MCAGSAGADAGVQGASAGRSAAYENAVVHGQCRRPARGVREEDTASKGDCPPCPVAVEPRDFATSIRGRAADPPWMRPWSVMLRRVAFEEEPPPHFFGGGGMW